MYIKKYLQKYNGQKIKLFVDMDGVIVDFVLNDFNYENKRPLKNSIKKLEELSKMDNIELYILSVTRHNEGLNQKQKWLDRYAPFFKKENRIIISREENNMEESSVLKLNYIKNIDRDDCLIIIIDDDPNILKELNKEIKDIILLKETVLID